MQWLQYGVLLERLQEREEARWGTTAHVLVDVDEVGGRGRWGGLKIATKTVFRGGSGGAASDGVSGGLMEIGGKGMGE